MNARCRGAPARRRGALQPFAWRSTAPGVALLLMLAAALTAAPTARAGIEVSLDSEMERLQAVEGLLADIEAANSEEDLRRLRERWQVLERELRDLRALPEDEVPRRERQIMRLEDALAELNDDAARLREEVLRYFPQAANRVAVFTLDDPDGLGLGDAISFLLSKDLLFSTRVRSFAVVNFQQGVAPRAPGEVGYFDKVDRLTRDQGYAVALWGRVARARDGVRVSLFGQAFTREEPPRFSYALRLPDAMGGQRLTAALTHDRFQLDDLVLAERDASRLARIADEVRTLRAAPRADAEARGRLSEERPYYIAESRGDWVRLQVRGGASGWTSVRAFCRSDCARLLRAAAFANEVVAAGAGLKPRPPDDGLSADTLTVYRELAALQALQAGDPKAAVRLVDAAGVDAMAGAERGGLANIDAVARIALELGDSRAAGYDSRRLDTASAVALVDELRSVAPFGAPARGNLRTLLAATPGSAAGAGGAIDPWKAQTQRATFLLEKKWALVVGVGDYAHLPDLRDPARDARRVADALAGNGYGVDLLVDPDRESLLRALEGHQDDAEVIVYIAGHVRRLDDGRPALLLGEWDPAQPLREAVALTDFVGDTGNRTLALDGALAEGVRGALDLPQLALLVNATPAAATFVDIGAGPFAYFLSEGLRGAAADADGDGFVQLTELAAHMNARAGKLGVPLRAVAEASRVQAPSYLAAPRLGVLERGAAERVLRPVED